MSIRSLTIPNKTKIGSCQLLIIIIIELRRLESQ